MLSLQISPVLAATVDGDVLHRDVHHLGAVDDRVHHGARKRHQRLGLERVDDERLALIHLSVEARQERQDPEDGEPQGAHRNQDGDQRFGH
jgi:hypothetical protein